MQTATKFLGTLRDELKRNQFAAAAAARDNDESPPLTSIFGSKKTSTSRLDSIGLEDLPSKRSHPQIKIERKAPRSGISDRFDEDRAQETSLSVQNTSGSSVFSANHNSPGTEEIDFPEGGLQAWLAVLGSFLGLVSLFGIANGLSAIETYISQHQLEHVSDSVVGWVFSIFAFISLLFGIFTGHVFDTQGPKIPIMLGTILTFCGVFATANCTEIYQFILAFGVVTGLGIAMLMSSLLGIIPHYFNKKRGMTIGLATVGGSVGGAVFPIMLRKLYASVGFQWAMRIFAVVLALLDIGAFFLIKPRFPPKKVNLPKGSFSFQNGAIFKTFGKYISQTLDWEAFKDPRFVTCTLAVTFSEVFLFTSMTYFGSYAISKGNSENTAYLLITIINVAGIFARAGAGFASDKVGKFNLMIIMISFASVFCLVIWLPFGQHISALYVFAVAYGIASAGVLSLSPVCISQISRVEDFGRKYSSCYFVVAIGCLIGVPVSGLFIKSKAGPHSSPLEKDYTGYVIFVAVLGFAGTVCWLVSRWFAVRNKLCVY